MFIVVLNLHLFDINVAKHLEGSLPTNDLEIIYEYTGRNYEQVQQVNADGQSDHLGDKN